MSTEDPAALDHALRRLLAAYRTETTPTRDEQTRLWGRLSTPIAPAAGATWSGLRLLIGGLAIVSATAAAFVLTRERDTAQPMPAVTTQTTTDRVSPTLPPATPPRVADQDPTVASPATARALQPRARAKPPAAIGEESGGLAAELASLERARSALATHSPNQALALLEEHERAFPKGAMIEERRAIRIVALCEAGKSEQGRAEARAFLAVNPDAALVSRIRSACGLAR